MLVEQRFGLFDKQVREAQDSDAISRNTGAVREPSDANVHAVLDPPPRGFVSQPVLPGNGLRARVSERESSRQPASSRRTWHILTQLSRSLVGNLRCQSASRCSAFCCFLAWAGLGIALTRPRAALQASRNARSRFGKSRGVGEYMSTCSPASSWKKTWAFERIPTRPEPVWT